jgi:hypothetical protein
MKTLTKNDIVRGTALLALHELKRTGRTGFAVENRMSRGSVSIEPTLKTRMEMAVLLAIEELSHHSNTTYRPVGVQKRGEIAVLAGHKIGPGEIRDGEMRAFSKFGLEYKGCGRNDTEGRLLCFSPSGSLLRSSLRS